MNLALLRSAELRVTLGVKLINSIEVQVHTLSKNDHMIRKMKMRSSTVSETLASFMFTL